MDNTLPHPIPLNTTWQPVATCQAPRAVCSWLSDPGSLTEKLKTLRGEFSVHLLGQTEGLAQAHEYAALGIAEQPVLIREVILFSGKAPLVFARSIIPFRALAHDSEFVQLGNNPLGERLFKSSDIQAGAIEAGQFSKDTPVAELDRLLQGDRIELWGRRRCFYLVETPILVAEVFLSNAPCYA
ncbi:chorismate--pyruvate lyase [Aliidiomarina iranensis]|uniref:Probable chorismate pyruvate-lyase n=1 Tax=Aliidiomarina iranensis TaxID=1434071 RepID=A0A432W2E7_9GAMM|nr:chorismate lyase [Aliidiomarina iranensis]RUO23391.1 chorismate--pyruvate lyase [Aliidiomarina iranensis]